MNYLLDKKIKRNNYLKYAFFVVVLFFLIYFRAGIFVGLSTAFHTIFRPALVVGNNIGEKLASFSSYFYSKNSLFLENENLKSKLAEEEAKMSSYNSLLDENLKIKEILNRKKEGQTLVLSAILSKPNQSPYDTLIIDAGSKKEIVVGQRVFALGNVPIGRVALVYPNSAKVILFSNPGEKTEVVISGQDTFMQVIGRGGGNFEMILPRDFVVAKGTEVVLPGITPFVLGVVETIISDPRDSFQKALLVSPVNIQEIKFVEVEK